jgi:hypothetical protein
MAHWLLGCPECNNDFAYTEGPPDSGVFACYSAKPELPEGGLGVVCPNCRISSVYKCH